MIKIFKISGKINGIIHYESLKFTIIIIMKMLTIFSKSFYFLKKHVFLGLWVSLISYFFYDTFIFYKNARQFYHLREILGLGLCISRGTATVLNLCCSLILLPMCKKLNQISYRIMSETWPKLFFFWLEKSKSFHMTVATTTLLFSVIHSISHLFNLWNFSASYSDDVVEVNFANYKNENPLLLIMSPAGLTGLSLLTIIVSMGVTSTRTIRRTLYNAFWYTHQLYLPFMILLILHPLSGVLKQQVLEKNDPSPDSSHYGSDSTNSTVLRTKFIAIKSTTWIWMVTPLACYSIDLIWRILSRNRARVEIVQVQPMPGKTVSLTLSCPHDQFSCRMGQYVLLQCLDVSLLEWHPFTVVQVPTSSQKEFVVWIRIKGDWTESLESLLLDYGNNKISLLVDGPFSSPMEGVRRSDIAICVAAGVGITPFVSTLHHMLRNPRSKFPGRVHLLWIVKYEQEIIWLAELADKAIRELRNANRPDRLHLEFYVTQNKKMDNVDLNAVTHVVILNENEKITNEINKYNKVLKFDEKVALLNPKILHNAIYKDKTRIERNMDIDNNYKIAKKHPILACRLRRGRPHWDRVFGYWVHLYPGVTLDLYCCGPKDFVKTLKHHCTRETRISKTTFTFVHEGF